MIPGLGDLSNSGGFTGGAATATSGDAGGSAGTGQKNINFGGAGNPNTTSAVIQNPIVILGVVALVYFFVKKR